MLIEGILTGVGVEDDTVQQVLSMLDEAKGSVKQQERLRSVPSGSFGLADTAAELELHAGKAHDHVVRAMREMAVGIGGYYDSVAHFRKDVHETDANEAAEYARRVRSAESVDVNALLASAASCTQQDNFYDAARCEAPTEADR